MGQIARKLAIAGTSYARSESIAGMHTISGGTVEIIGGTLNRIGTTMIVGRMNTESILRFYFNGLIARARVPRWT
jgi:hypothetical protein